jgi:hypothetical protein
MRAATGQTVSNERVSGAEPTTPEAIMAETDSTHDADERSASRRGGAPWPPPDADTAWWTQDAGTHTAAHPTSAAPSERLAPDIPAPAIAQDVADSLTSDPAAPSVSAQPVDPAAAEVAPETDVIEARTVRVTRRRGPRPTKRPSDQPARPRRQKSADSADRTAAVEPAIDDRSADFDSTGPARIAATITEAAGEPAAEEPAAIEPAKELAANEPAGAEPPGDERPGERDASAVAVPVDDPDATDAAENAAPTDADEQATSLSAADEATGDEATDDSIADDSIGEDLLPAEPADEPSATRDEAGPAEAETSLEVPEFAPIESSAGESDDEPAYSGPEATADEPTVGPGAPFPVAATIVADGDFVEEPEFAVPDLGAPPSTRRNAPDTGFPIRTAPPVRPPARREPAPAVTAPPQPVRRRGRRTPVPVQAPAHGDVVGDLWDGDADRVPGSLAPARRRQPVPTRRPHSHRKAPRRPAFGLPALLVFALAAAFFAWVSATPLLLTVGHGSRGVATVGTCSVHGIGRNCAEFVAADRSFSAAVTLLGPASANASAGAKLDAQMVSRGSNLAYAGNSTDLLLHWIPGVVLLILCGFGIAWATGALRLAGRRTRSLALLGSFGGPILLFAGMLAYAW